MAPEFSGELDQVGKLFNIAGFFQVAVGSKLVGASDIRAIGGGGQDDGGDHVALGVFLQPGEDVEAGAARQIDLGDEDAGEGEFRAIRIPAGALEIVQHILAIGAGVDGSVDADAEERALKPGDIFFVIIREQNDQVVRHEFVISYERWTGELNQIELPIKAEKIKIIPGLQDAAILKGGERHAVESDFSSRGRNPEPFAGMGGTDAATCGHSILLSDSAFDRDMDIRQGGDEGEPECFELIRASERMGGAPRQSIDQRIRTEQFMDQIRPFFVPSRTPARVPGFPDSTLKPLTKPS